MKYSDQNDHGLLKDDAHRVFKASLNHLYPQRLVVNFHGDVPLMPSSFSITARAPFLQSLMSRWQGLSYELLLGNKSGTGNSRLVLAPLPLFQRKTLAVVEPIEIRTFL